MPVAIQLLVALAAPATAAALVGRRLRARAAPSDRVRAGLVLGATLAIVHLLLLIPLASWVAAARAGAPARALSAPVVLAAALCLAGALRLAARAVTRLAIRRMRRAGEVRASALPGVRMRGMFAHLGARRHVGVALASAAIAAVYEELAFRGLLQAAAGAYLGPWGGVAVSAGAFALMHGAYGPTGRLFALSAGVILGASVELLGTLAPAVVGHLAYNVLTLAGVYRAPRPAPAPAPAAPAAAALAVGGAP